MVAETVFAAYQCTERNREVHQTNQGVGTPWMYSPGPGDDQRHTSTTFKLTVFTATQRARRPVVAKFLVGFIFITVVEHRPIVTEKNNQCVSGKF